MSSCRQAHATRLIRVERIINSSFFAALTILVRAPKIFYPDTGTHRSIDVAVWRLQPLTVSPVIFVLLATDKRTPCSSRRVGAARVSLTARSVRARTRQYGRAEHASIRTCRALAMTSACRHHWPTRYVHDDDVTFWAWRQRRCRRTFCRVGAFSWSAALSAHDY